MNKGLNIIVKQNFKVCTISFNKIQWFLVFERRKWMTSRISGLKFCSSTYRLFQCPSVHDKFEITKKMRLFIPLFNLRWICMGRQSKIYTNNYYYGVATIVQGSIVQGDSCQRDFCPMTQLSKETIVQWYFCPRRLLPVKSLFKLIFLIFYWKYPHSLIIEYQKK